MLTCTDILLENDDADGDLPAFCFDACPTILPSSRDFSAHFRTDQSTTFVSVYIIYTFVSVICTDSNRDVWIDGIYIDYNLYEGIITQYHIYYHNK